MDANPREWGDVWRRLLPPAAMESRPTGLGVAPPARCERRADFHTCPLPPEPRMRANPREWGTCGGGYCLRRLWKAALRVWASRHQRVANVGQVSIPAPCLRNRECARIHANGGTCGGGYCLRRLWKAALRVWASRHQRVASVGQVSIPASCLRNRECARIHANGVRGYWLHNREWTRIHANGGRVEAAIASGGCGKPPYGFGRRATSALRT